MIVILFPLRLGFKQVLSFYKFIFPLLERMKAKPNICSAYSPLWFLQLWIIMHFPMFVPKHPKSTKALDCHANDSSLGKSLRIKSTTSSSTHFFIEAICGILDDVCALWNPTTIDHAISDCLKMDPLVDLAAKAIPSANWCSILFARDFLCGFKLASRYNIIFVEPYNP